MKKGPHPGETLSMRGDGGNRTHGTGFADLRLNHLATSPYEENKGPDVSGPL